MSPSTSERTIHPTGRPAPTIVDAATVGVITTGPGDGPAVHEIARMR